MLGIFLALATLAGAQQWDASQYPNPRQGGSKACKMRSVSNICDPDEVLSMDARYRLNNELQRISMRTGNDRASSFCIRKGTDAVLAIVRQGSQQLVNDLSRLWHMDDQCRKSVVFLLSADDRKLYFAAEPRVDFNTDELQSIIAANSAQLVTGNFVPALSNIFKEIGKKTDLGGEGPPSRPEDIHPKAATSIVISALSSLIIILYY